MGFLLQLNSHKATQFCSFCEMKETWILLLFMADITSHLDELNLKLLGKNNSACDLIKFEQFFQKKLEDLQGSCAHFPKVQQQIQAERDVSPRVHFIEKQIEDFKDCFDSFSLGGQLFLQDLQVGT